MTTMVTELYKALKTAGAPDDEAMEAAKAVAEHEGKSELLNDVDKRLAIVQAELAIMKKFLWVIVAGVIALVIKNFMPV